MSKEKFQGAKYITKGVKAEIPTKLQMLMWKAIAEMKVEEVDYLQIFRLSVDDNKQIILHEQEQPQYQRRYKVDIDEPVNAKVYVIDSNCEYATMLLAEEY